MPTYEYKCHACQSFWEDFLPMSSADGPTKLPCPKCGKKKVKREVCLPQPFADPIRIGRKKPDRGFREVLAKVAEAHPRHKMNIP